MVRRRAHARRSAPARSVRRMGPGRPLHVHEQHELLADRADPYLDGVTITVFGDAQAQIAAARSGRAGPGGQPARARLRAPAAGSEVHLHSVRSSAASTSACSSTPACRRSTTRWCARRSTTRSTASASPTRSWSSWSARARICRGRRRPAPRSRPRTTSTRSTSTRPSRCSPARASATVRDRHPVPQSRLPDRDRRAGPVLSGGPRAIGVKANPRLMDFAHVHRHRVQPALPRPGHRRRGVRPPGRIDDRVHHGPRRESRPAELESLQKRRAGAARAVRPSSSRTPPIANSSTRRSTTHISTRSSTCRSRCTRRCRCPGTVHGVRYNLLPGPRLHRRLDRLKPCHAS